LFNVNGEFYLKQINLCIEINLKVILIYLIPVSISDQKLGTTLFYHQLNLHPEIWLPPLKELHYFDRNKRNRLVYSVLSKGLGGRFIGSRTKLLLKRESMYWAKHFFFDNRTSENYKNLFQPSGTQISGEITPAYARLNNSTIEHIHRSMPNVKLIYFLRNPVERAWSQMNMYRRRSDVDRNIVYSNVFKFLTYCRTKKSHHSHVSIYIRRI
jgi:hypothetical protein